MGLRVLSERVLIKPDPEEATRGGIYLPDTAKERPQRGKVLAVGEGRRLDNGTVAPLEVKVGDRVLYSKYAGTEVHEGDEEYLVLSIDSILAKDA